MKCGDFPSTRFALYVRQIANGHEKPKANSIANSSISAVISVGFRKATQTFYQIIALFCYDNIRLAAEGTDCTGVDRSTAIRARPLQQLAAHSAILPADRIGRLTVWKEKTNLLYKILLVRRAVGIRAESLVKKSGS